MITVKSSVQIKKHPNDLQRLDNQLCFAVYSSMLGFNKVYRRLLKELDITYPQYLVMLILWEKDGINVSEICEKLFLETTTLTPLLKRLEVRGLLVRKRLPKDERQVIISLTTKGQELRKTAQEIPGCIKDSLACSFDEIVEIRNKLVKLRGNLMK